MDFHLVELKMEKYIKEHLEDNQLTMEKEDKPTDVVLQLTELGMLCCIHYLEDRWDIIVNFSLNILYLT